MNDEIQVIEARPATVRARVKAAWQYRRYYPILLREITMRKFRNTLLGFWWLILRPMIPTVIAIVTFTYFVQVDTADVPYGIFFLAGFIPWNLLQTSSHFMSRSMMWTRSIMKKMYLPKLLVPIASVGPPLIELLITIAALIIMIVVYSFTQDQFRFTFTWRLLLFPVSIILSFIMALSVGMVISVIALFMRDIIYSVNYVMQMLMFVTPVLYPVSSVPENLQWLFIVFNPMTGVIETSRWALTGSGVYDPLWLLVSIVEIGLIALLCLTFFARAESYLSDIV
jgi:lipopolysaccharide transport system permease protein